MNTKKPIQLRLARKSIQQGECIVWTGARNNTGYGLISIDGKARTTHRVSYELHYGSIPDGMVVMHSCDNPPCINPAHLSVGSHKENTQDMQLKKRANKTKGDAHHKAKLTSADAAVIRNRHVPYSRKNSTHALAAEFSVSQSTIQAIVKGRTWKPA